MAYEPRGLAVISGSSDTRFKVLDDGSVELKGKTIGDLAITSGSVMMAGAASGGLYGMQPFDIRGAHGGYHIGVSSSNSALQTALDVGDNRDNVSYALTYIYENAAASVSDLSDTSISGPSSGQLLIYDGTNSWDNISLSGDATLAANGAITISANAVEGSMLNNNVISGQTAMTGDVADTDELMIDDGGTLKRIDFSVFRDAVFTDVSGDATVAAGGALTIAAGAVEHGMLAEDIISGQSELLHADIADADDLMIHDTTASSVKKVGVDSLRDHFFGAVSGDATIADGGALTIAAQAVENSMLADDAVGSDEIADNAVLTAHITDANVTLAKLANLDSMRVIGNVTGGSAAPAAVTILDEDDLSSNSATALATQQSIKAYVDSVSAGLDPKESVHLATTAALPACTYNNGAGTLTADANGVLTVDGVAVALNDRVLVKNQASAVQNGIYKCTTAGDGSTDFVLTRASDANNATKLTGGAYTFVEQGSTNDNAGFVCSNDSAITFGSDDITFVQFSGAGSITAGDGITKSGSTLSITTAGVTNAMLADDAVGADELAANAVVNDSIAANAAIDMDKLDGGSLASSLTDLAQGDLMIAADVSDSNNLKSITFSNLEDAIFGNVSGDATIAAGGALTIANDAVEQAMIADDAVGADQLASSAVVTASIVDDSVTNAKLANMTQGTIKVGGSSNAPTDLDAKTSGQIIVGNGTGVASVAVSGDATLAANGALTIAANAVEGSMLNNDVISAQTELAHADIVDDDELAISDGGVLKKVGVDSLRDHFFGAVSGDATIADGGALTLGANVVEGSMLNNNVISGQTDLGSAAAAQADELLFSDGGTLKKITFSDLEDSIFGNVSGDATVAAGGALTIAANAVEGSMLNNDVISAQTELVHADIVDADELAISDGGVLKKVGVDSLRDHYFGVVSGDATIADGGALTIAAGAVENSMLADDAVGADELASNAVVTASIVDSNVTLAKLADIADMRVIGNVSGGSATPAAVSILDENDMTSNSATALATQASIKAYVDSVASGLDVKDSVVAATTASFTMASTASSSTLVLANGEGGFDAGADTYTVDGVSLAAGNRVLIKDGVNSNSAGVHNKWNGIYTVGALDGATLTLTRATDSDSTSELTPGAFTFVEQGTVNADNGFVCTTDTAITIGTTAITWAQFSGAGSITAGAGIAKSGSTLSLNIDSLGALSSVGSIHQTDDHFLISDGGTEKKITFSDLEDEIFGNISGDATVAGGGALTIANDAVEQAMIADDAVGADQLASNAVVNASVVDGALKADKLDIDGSTDIGAGLADADLFIVDDGASGANRKSAMSRVPTYVFSKVSGDATVASNGALTIANDAVEQAMIADDAVGADQLASNAVVNASIVDGTIAFDKLADAANIARLDQNETVAGIYTFSNTTEASGSTRAASVGGALFSGGITTEKALFVKGTTSTGPIATLGTPAEYGTSGEHITEGGFSDYRKVIRLGGSLQMARLNGEHGTDQSVLCDLSDATNLAAGQYDGYMIYVTSRMHQTAGSGTLGTLRTGTDQTDNRAAAQNNFDVSNKFYFCEEGVWHMSPFATAAEE